MYQKVLVVLLLFFSTSNAQIFNSANIINNKQFALSLNPMLINGLAEDDAGFFIQGEYGIGYGMQATSQLGLGFNETYFGIMIEKSIIRSAPMVSFSGGIHSFEDIGLDFTLNFSASLNKLVSLYVGIDSDLVFAEKPNLDISTDEWKKESDTKFLTWFFMGTEVILGKNITLLFETEIGIAEEAYNVFGTGLKFYL